MASILHIDYRSSDIVYIMDSSFRSSLQANFYLLDNEIHNSNNKVILSLFSLIIYKDFVYCYFSLSFFNNKYFPIR